MRTNIEIDDKLMEEARSLSGLKTKKEIVHSALIFFVQMQKQGEVRRYRGKLKWTEDLDKLRESRFASAG